MLFWTGVRGVMESAYAGFNKGLKSCVAFIDQRHRLSPLLVGHAIAAPRDLKHKQMAVAPAQGGLHDAMQCRQRHGFGHAHASPG